MAVPIGQNEYGDDIYQTPNGERTGTQITQELAQAGWGGGGDPVSVYNQTAAAGQQSASPTAAVPNTLGQTTDMDAIRRFFGETAGFSREELAEKARMFNEELAYKERMWEREGLPRLEIDRRLAALKEREVEATIGLDRAKLGLSYLTTAAQMGGPADYFQQAAFMRGARGQGAGSFLDALNTNTALPAFTGVGDTPPAVQTPMGLTMQMGGQTVTIPQPGAPGTAAPGGPAQYNTQALEAALEGQIGKANWQSSEFRRNLAAGMPIEQAVREAADVRNFAAPNLSQYAIAPTAAPAAGLPTATTPIAAAPVLGRDAMQDELLRQIGSIFQRGPTGLTPGSLERLDPNELDLMKSGARRLGYDPEQWLRSYQRGGIGQQAAAPF